MGTIVRGLALALALIWPVIGNAVAIIDGPSSLVTGWSNSQGSFAVDLSGPSTADLAGAGVASYSTAASVFSLSASSISYARPVGVASTGLVPADVQIVAAIQGNGTASGNLLTGTLTIRAGPNGFPGTGDCPGVGAGQLLLAGNAIEAAALPSQFSIDFLFQLTYTAPALSGLGDFVTFWGPYPCMWGGCQPGAPFAPWGKDVGAALGFDFFDIQKTDRIPEPGSVALVGIALASVAFARRRKLL